MKKQVFQCAHALVVLSLLGLVGCYAKVEVSDRSAEKAIAIDLVDPPCAEPGSEAGYIEGNGFGAENVTITVGGIEAEVLAATGMDASFVVPEGLEPGPVEVVVENPGGRIATIRWVSCEVECDPPDCDDDNECTTDTCDTSDGTCINDPVADGTLCGTGGVCEEGACRERSWGTPVLLESGAGNALLPQVAVDPSGNATAVWVQYNGTSYDVWSNRYTPATGWGTPLVIDSGAGGAEDPQVAVDPDGNATAVWRQYDGTAVDIWANQYTPAAGWGTAVLIESGAGIADHPHVAMDPDGNATVVWDQSRDIWANRYTPAAGWGIPVLLESGGGNAYASGVAVDPDGNATVVWRQYNGGATDPDVWSNRYTPAAGWGTPVVFDSGAVGGSYEPQVAVDPDGNVTAVWVHSTDNAAAADIWSNRYTPATGWGTAVRIESGAGAATLPQVAVDPDGNATAVWRQYNGTNYDIWSNRYTPAAGWGTPVVLDSGASFDDLAPQVAVDPDGNATAVWVLSYDIWSNRYTPAAGWGIPVLLESGGGIAYKPQVAVDPDGNATVVWYQSDDIWSNRFE